MRQLLDGNMLNFGKTYDNDKAIQSKAIHFLFKTDLYTGLRIQFAVVYVCMLLS